MASAGPSPVLSLARAAQHLRAGRPDAAVGPLREASAQSPANSTIQHDLGVACLETGALPESIAAFRQAVSINPRYTDAWFRLGLALERFGDVRAAIVAYDRATGLLPSLTEAWYRAGSLVFALGYRNEAIGCFRRAAATGRKTSFGRLGEARALLAEDRDPEAERVLRQLLSRDPANAVAHDLLGNILADAGRFEPARECFARAIAHAPAMAGSYYDLVRCRRMTPADSGLLATMQAALMNPALEAEQRIRVHLALGKAADDLGDHASAMQQFDTAGTLRRGLVAFDCAEFDRQIERLTACFTPETIAQAASRGSTDATPMLIIGMPRSGTTLTEQIISSHPAVEAGGELNDWNERGVAWLQDDPPKLDQAWLDRAATDYVAVLRAKGPTAARVTDKMPFNFLWAGLIHVALPNATIIHCRRAAIDTALSIHQTHFNPRLAFPTGGAELVAYFRGYQRLTEHWRRVLPANRLIEIDYEDLTSAPETAIRRLIAACGLPWDESCLRPERNPRVVKTPSRWQARQPIYRDATQRWRRCEPWLGPLGALLDSAQRLHPLVTPAEPMGG